MPKWSSKLRMKIHLPRQLWAKILVSSPQLLTLDTRVFKIETRLNLWKTAIKKFKRIWSLSRPYHFNFFISWLLQILLGSFLNTLSHMILAVNKQLLDFQVMGNSTLCKWCRNLGFCYQWHNKKCKCINDLMLILCLQPATLLKLRHRHRCFFVNFVAFFSV